MKDFLRRLLREILPENRKRVLYFALAAVCAAVFAACAAWLILYVTGTRQSVEELEVMKAAYVTESSEETTEEEPAPAEVTAPDAEAERETLLAQYGVPDKTIDFAALQEQENADIYAWITVPDTQIDYPVLQHPTEPDYYLEYNIDGTKGYPGCIYSQLLNSKDFTDSVTVLYGHNMKNGSMFANLHKYEDPEFFESHPYLYVYTPEATLVYQVFAAYKYNDGHILQTNDVTTEAGLEAYIDSIYEQEGENNQYNDDARPAAQDRILDLSTCISGQADKRWIVSAKLVEKIGASETAQ